jgi:predicted helicase
VLRVSPESRSQGVAGALTAKNGTFGNVFSEGSKTPISITLLIRNPDLSHKGRIHYQDIGDYKTTTEKLEFVKQLKSFGNGEFIEIVPNKHSDWINQRRDDFETFIPIADKENKNDSAKALFSLITMGIMTGKDPYVYNSNRGQLSRYMKEMINIFNQSIDQSSPIENLSQIKWDRKLLREFSNKRKVEFDENSVRRASYRPFVKTNLYFSKTFVSDAGQNYKLFPNADSENLVITLNEKSSNDFSAFITDAIPDLHFNGDSQCLPLYIHLDKKEEADFSLFDPH